MKTRTLAVVTLSILAASALPCRAQDKLAAQQEKPIREVREGAAKPEPCCGHKVLWVDYYCPVQTLQAREYATKELCSTWKVDYREEEKTFTQMVITPREVTKEVSYCTTEAVTTTDPVTGCTSTCMKPVTKKKIIKETIFEAAPVKKVIKVQVPFLAPDTSEIEHKHTIYEWKFDMVKKGCAISVEGGEVANTKDCVVGPKAECPK